MQFLFKLFAHATVISNIALAPDGIVTIKHANDDSINSDASLKLFSSLKSSRSLFDSIKESVKRSGAKQNGTEHMTVISKRYPTFLGSQLRSGMMNLKRSSGKKKQRVRCEKKQRVLFLI